MIRQSRNTQNNLQNLQGNQYNQYSEQPQQTVKMMGLLKWDLPADRVRPNMFTGLENGDITIDDDMEILND